MFLYTQKGGCLTLRNVAAHGGKVARATILDLKGEPLLREIMEKHPDMAENHVKPTLRDLGFEVAAKPNPHQYVPDQNQSSSGANQQRLSNDATFETS